MNTKEILKEFLNNNLYHVMHETDIDNDDLEHFFVLFQIKDIFQISPTKERSLAEAEIIKTYLDGFQKINSIQNLSAPTLKFIYSKNNKFIYIPLVSLDKNHHFYLKRKKDLENNYENFLSIRMIGEPCNSNKHLNYTIDSKISDIKDISLGITSVAKDLVQEKTPIIKEKLFNLGKKLKSLRK